MDELEVIKKCSGACAKAVPNHARLNNIKNDFILLIKFTFLFIEKQWDETRSLDEKKRNPNGFLLNDL
jgi:hypothetical protein